jgi:hypothetical protein
MVDTEKVIRNGIRYKAMVHKVHKVYKVYKVVRKYPYKPYKPYKLYNLINFFYFLIFSVTQNSPKYFPRRILVCESIEGIEPRNGAIIGTNTHWRSIWRLRHLEYFPGLGGISKKLSDIEIMRPNMARVIRYLVMNGRLWARTL